MLEYRAYLVGIEGRIIVEPIICADDAEAVAKAQRLLDRSTL